MTTHSLLAENIKFIIVHCSDSSWGDVPIINDWHRQRGFDAPGGIPCGYHFVIRNGFRTYSQMKDGHRDEADGLVEQGRSTSYWGAHALGYNDRSIGVCLIGTGAFTQRQLGALADLIWCLRRQYGIPVDNVLGHYETKLCAGKTCPNMDMVAFRKLLTNNAEEKKP